MHKQYLRYFYVHEPISDWHLHLLGQKRSLNHLFTKGRQNALHVHCIRVLVWLFSPFTLAATSVLSLQLQPGAYSFTSYLFSLLSFPRMGSGVREDELGGGNTQIGVSQITFDRVSFPSLRSVRRRVWGFDTLYTLSSSQTSFLTH